MKRNIIGAGLFCLVLFAAILAGYWDMLSTEKLKIVRDEATQAVGEIADVVRPGSGSAGSQPATVPVTSVAPSAAVPDVSPPADNAAAGIAPAPAESSAAPAPDATATSAPAPAPQAQVSSSHATPAAPTPETPLVPTAETPAPATAEAEPPAEAGVAALETAPTAATAVSPENSTPSPASGPAATPEPLALPTFDIVRVEPDGSTVLAGRAPAGSAIVLLDGKRRVAEDKAGAGGDFVVALDERLAVGEHQLTLQATAPDGRAITSAETVVVSIPEKGRENELLAMVESPDRPSRLISIPAAPTPPAVEAAAPPAGVGTQTVAVEVPVLPSAPSQAQSEAELTLPLVSAPKTAPALPTPPVAVEAVEIEGKQIYIAGRAAGATSVRVYVDNEFLAAASKLTADRFLVTAQAPVRPGEHLVRADALDGAGAVIARVEVPFNRPEGRAMSAISAPAEPAKPSARATEAPPTASPIGTPSSGAETVTSAQIAAAPTAPAKPAAAEPPTAIVQPSPTGTGEAAASAPSVADTATVAAEPAAAVQNPAVAPPSPGEDVAVLRQPALEAVEARVIIRRGDTLWRISRNTYGRGARYTVIYLANGDQIRDPDRIYPGQVFRTPKDQEAAAPATPGQ